MLCLISRSRASHLSERALIEQMDLFDLVLAGLALKAVKTPDFDREATATLAAGRISRMIDP